MILYKLTDENGQTRGPIQWGENVTHEAGGPEGGPLCSDSWLHAYTDPLLAVFLNPIHANFKSPRLWEAEGEVGAENSRLKVGCRRLTTIRELPLPEVTLEQRVRFAILCALEVDIGRCPEWTRWAERWLSGEDRSEGAARAAAQAAQAPAAWAAARAAEARAAEAAWAPAAWAAARAAGASPDLAALAKKAVS